MVLGEHCSLVSRVEPDPVTISILFLDSATLETASATPELMTSVIRSTPPVSYHWRAIPEAMSGLFWWSADTSSTLNGGLACSTKSSTAICAGVRAPAPARSENAPAISVSTPILTVPSEIAGVCATAPAHAPASVAATRAAREMAVLMVFSLVRAVWRTRLLFLFVVDVLFRSLRLRVIAAKLALRPVGYFRHRALRLRQ